MNRRTLLPAIIAASLLAAACDPGPSDDTSDTSAIIDETRATEPEPADVAEPASEPAVAESATATPPAPPAPEAPTDAPTPEAPPTTEAPPAPAAPSFEPLAVVDVGSTGGGNFEVTDLAPVLADSQVVGVPIPNTASLIGNRVIYESNPFPAADGGVQHGSNFQLTTQVTTDMAIADVLAAYQGALDGVGEYEYSNSESTSDTRSLVELTASGAGPTGRLPQYIITVTGDTEFPGVVQIDVRRIASGVPGDIPLPIGAAATELAEPMRLAAENDIPVLQWSYDLSYSQFAISGTSQFVTALYRLDFGEGTIGDLPGAIDRTQGLFGTAVEQTELRDDYFQLSYGDLSAPMVDVRYVESTDNFLEVTWRINREIG